MKKTLVLCLTLIFLFTTCLSAFAAPSGAPSVTVKDPAGDIIKVSGSSTKPEYVTLIVLNPGKAASDIDFADSSSVSSAVQYISTQWAEGGNYSFDVPMVGTAGGNFTILLTAGDTKYTQTPVGIEYYYSGEKKEIIKKINDADTYQEIVSLLKNGTDGDGNLYNGVLTLYSLSDNKLYATGNYEEPAKIIKYMLDENGTFDESDVNTFNLAVETAGIIGAYNAHLDNIVLANGILDYTDSKYLDIESTDEYNDYLSKLSGDGRENLHDVLIGGEYNTLDEIRQEFRELVAYYGIVDHNESGYGHMEHYFDTYEDVYDDYGFKLSKLNDSNKNSVFKALLKCSTKDMDDLKDAFNDIVNEKKGGSGGSSSSHSSGSGSSSFVATPITPSQDTTYIAPKAFFHDISAVPWAEESILALAEKGIVNGKGNDNFAPNDSISRAEYLKILVMALNLTDDNATVSFADVDANHWAKKYIASAVNAGVTNGVSDTEFDPNGLVTREQAAVFTARAMEKCGATLTADDNVFADDAQISSWARVSVNSLKKAGILNGTGDNSVLPAANLSRAEAAKIIYSVMSSMGLISEAE